MDRQSSGARLGGAELAPIEVLVASRTSEVTRLRTPAPERTSGRSVHWLAPRVGDLAQLRQALQRRQPDVLLLGDEMFDELDAETLARLQRGSTVLHVMLVSRGATARLCDEVLRCRFHGVLPADCSAETCERALRAVCAGEIWLPRAHLSRVVARGMATSRYDDVGPPRQAPHAPTHGALSRREQQVADFLHYGLTNKEIAGRLGIMEDTVKKHLQNIFGKLGVRRRTLVALDTVSRWSSDG